MHLNSSQLAILKSAIQNDPVLSEYSNTPDDNVKIADAFNELALPAFYVWRTNVSESEYTSLSGIDVSNNNAATNWSWPAYIARSIQEQNAWSRMFIQGFIDPSRPNVQTGIGDIFSGGTGVAQDR